MTDVEDAVGGGALCRALFAGVPVRVGAGWQLGDGEDPLDDVVDEGEVAAEIALVVDVDGLARQDGSGELGDGHVGPAPGAVDGEKAQPCGGQAVERRVGVGHQLAALLGGGIEGNRVVHLLIGTERQLLAHAVDRAGGGVDQMPDVVLAAPLQHRQHAGEVALAVGKGVFQRVAHPRLGTQVDHPLELPLGKQGGHAGPVRQLALYEAKVGEGGQHRQASLFEAHLVVVVEVVQPHHLMTRLAQPSGDVKTDKTGGAGDQILHGWGPVQIMGLLMVVGVEAARVVAEPARLCHGKPPFSSRWGRLRRGMLHLGAAAVNGE